MKSSSQASKSYGIVGVRKPPRRLTRNKQEARLEGMKYLAVEQAKLKWEESSKGMRKGIRNLVGKLAEKIDPLDLMATGALTPTIYGLIKENAAWLSGATKLYQYTFAPLLPGTPLGIGNLPTGMFGFFVEVFKPFFTSINWPGTQQDQPKDRFTSDVAIWIFSFAIAYIVVKHAGEIFTGLNNGLSKLIPLMLGIAA